jgi:hypothetical protein
MKTLKLLDGFFMFCFAAVVAVGVVGCTSTAATTTSAGPGSGAIVNSDSVITAEIEAVRSQSSGYPWELDIIINSSDNVGNLPNPTKDSVGKEITVKTDQNMDDIRAGDKIFGKVKYTGDVPKPGITLYLYDVKKQ